jgi:HD-GYP domain-containing protein (c-di-GMP phosphodiesterase class II)
VVIEAGPPSSQLPLRFQKLQRLLWVAKSLGAERDVDRLLVSILDEAQDVISADRCSLFIVDRERRELWSKIAHGMGAGEIRIPLGKGIAGQCAETCQVIHITDPYSDPRFNPEVDRMSGYRTTSILAVPMLDRDGAWSGVLQALNRKGGGAFTAEDQELLLALGGISAVALENAFLHRDIARLFEGFLRASVYAIEARDPTTSGHSERVAGFSIAIAEAVNSANGVTLEAWPDGVVRFTDADLRELRYAALLHDFGKVGVREHVLVKANKLYPHELALLRERFEHARACTELGLARRRGAILEPAGLDAAARSRLLELDAERQRALAELDEMWGFVQTCNAPTVLEQHGFERLSELRARRFENCRGEQLELLSESERVSLSIPRGSLTPEERLEIESHVTHTREFLNQIPWTRELKRVPEIAGKHHEKLSGKGYPGALAASVIPPQTRIMTIADIYDALTASDRPYKKALPHAKALDILHAEANVGLLDHTLLEIFVESRAHEQLAAVTERYGKLA